MKLIIDISDEMFDVFKKHGIMAFDNFDEYDKDILADKIANGIVLPEGHGDLIDRDVAYTAFDRACFSYEGGLLKYIPTVIPADKKGGRLI